MNKIKGVKKWWQKQTKRDKVTLCIILISCFGFLLYNQYKDKELEIPLSEAIVLSQAKIFNEMTIYSDGDLSKLELVVGDKVNYQTTDINGKGVTLTDSQRVTADVGTLNLQELEDMGFVLPPIYSAETGGTSDGIWERLMPMFILIGGGALIYYLGANGYFATGRRFKKGKNDIRLNDIGGISEIKDGISDVISFLKDKRQYDEIGAIIPRGILLVGLPGTGKTMLAKAIAAEADVPFYFVSGSEFHSMWVGLAGMRVKGLFKRANKSTSIVFIDEFDSIAHKRTMASGDASREWNHTLNQLLAEMDGFKKNSNVLVIAATNRVDVLDPAVLRPGRFDRRITVPLPNYKDRCEILEIHAKGKVVSGEVKFNEIARQTTGFSGADLALLINEAAIMSVKEHKNIITMANLTKAIDKVLVGDERKNFTITDKERKLIAYHEAGHAVVASFSGEKVGRITILPHGDSGGFTRIGEEVESILVSKSKAMCTISILLGGRVGEAILGDISSSAQGDIKKANEVARQMVEQYGMGERFGLRCRFDNALGLTEMGDDSLKVMEDDIADILKGCYEIAKGIIEKHSSILDRIAQRLLEVETLDGIEIQRLIE